MNTLAGNAPSLMMLAILFGVPTTVVYYERRGQYARRIRAWRRRMTAMSDQPFHLQLLTPGERASLIGHGGQTSDDWADTWAADFLAGRRDRPPTCGDYLREFGRHPRVEPADDRTLVRH